MKNRKEMSIKTFNQQAKTYDNASYGLHARKLYPHILQKIIQIQGNDFLDLGCGTGELMGQVLAEDKDRKITGLDLSEKMLEIAEVKIGTKATFVLGDAEKLPFSDNTFDLVYCNDSFHHYPHPKQVIYEINRVLKKDGVFIIGDCFQKGLTRIIMNIFMKFSHDGDIRLYSKKEMYQMLGLYFHALEWEHVNSTSFVVRGTK